jgi:diketogulonate reductase-like aldo/keto reductase
VLATVACAVAAEPLRASPATVTLNNGVSMPWVGIGTAGLGEGVYATVKQALQAGYKLIDSAQAKEWYREVSGTTVL